MKAVELLVTVGVAALLALGCTVPRPPAAPVPVIDLQLPTLDMPEGN